jgi:hypothetical protein
MDHTAIGMGAEAKEIKEIHLEELDNKGAQAQVGAKRAGKTAKSPKTKRQASMPMKKDRQAVGTEAKADDCMGGDWDDSDAESPGGRANDKSSAGYDTPPPSLHWGIKELQQRVYQEQMAASVFAVVVTKAHFLGMGGINKAEAAIQAILNPWRGGPMALEDALDPELSKARAYIAILADYLLGFTLLYNLQRVDQELRPGNPICARVVAFGGEVQTNSGTPDVFVSEEDEGALFKRLYLLVTETVMAYEQDSDGDYAHTFVLDPTVEDCNAKPTTRMMPIPLEWAPMFVDNPNFGTAIRQMRDLFMSIMDDEKYRLVDIFGMMTGACCAAKASDGVGSTLAID